MANVRLKKEILKVVDNQLKANDPPCTGWAYRELQIAGYTAGEAKERIGSVVLSQIYDCIKENRPYDEMAYEMAMREMVQQAIDFEWDASSLPNEWEEIGELIEDGQDASLNDRRAEALETWLQAWEKTKENLRESGASISVSGLDEATDYEYNFEGWLQDMEMELAEAGENEKHLQFCREVLQAFDWDADDDGGYKMGVGEDLYALGNEAEGQEWFETWLKKEPHNEDALVGYSRSLASIGKEKEALALLEKEIRRKACNLDNEMIYEHAAYLAGKLGQPEKEKNYQKQRDDFMKELEAAIEEADDDMFDEFFEMPMKPIVKEQKIYPNEPCPCGSGKKYKKCCGRGE